MWQTVSDDLDKATRIQSGKQILVQQVFRKREGERGKARQMITHKTKEGKMGKIGVIEICDIIPFEGPSWRRRK